MTVTGLWKLQQGQGNTDLCHCGCPQNVSDTKWLTNNLLLQNVSFSITANLLCVCMCVFVSSFLIYLWVATLVFWLCPVTPMKFVRTCSCRINKSRTSKFHHMPSHVFPSSSWEHSAPRLSSLLTVWLGLCHSKMEPALQWAQNVKTLVVFYLWATCLPPCFNLVLTQLELMVLIPPMLKIHSMLSTLMCFG